MTTRSSWTIEKWNETTQIWVADGSIYAPNADLPIDKLSTQAKTQLANGSYSYMLPETKYLHDPMKLIWYYVDYDDSLTAKLDAYIINGDYLRITNHKGEKFSGRFINLRRVFLVSPLDDETIDWEANFEVCEYAAS